MTYRILSAEELRALAAPNTDAPLFRAHPGRGWGNVVHKDHAVPTVAEVHEWEMDVYLVLEGTATLTLGGTLLDATSPGAGQWRGTGITGGVDHSLAPGDCILIPAGTPHMVDAQHSRLVYLVVKQDERP